MLIDTHCHLNDERLAIEAGKIIAEFPLHMIESAICVGYDMPSSEAAAKLAFEHENVYAAVGIHPHDASSANYDAYERLSTLSSSSKVVAIGEIGLDYHYDLSPREIQRGVFAEQLELADVLGLPVVLHIRDAYDDARRILFDNRKYLDNGLLLHCYSGSSEFVKIFGEFDAYFAFGGAITFTSAKHNLEALRAVPQDRLLLETDCPYMTPVPFRGKINRPEYICYVADKVAAELGIERAELDKITTANAKRLFVRMGSAM